MDKENQTKDFLEIYSDFLLLKDLLNEYCQAIDNPKTKDKYKEYLKKTVLYYVDKFLEIFPYVEELQTIKKNLLGIKTFENISQSNLCSEELKDLYFLQEALSSYFKIKGLNGYYFITLITDIFRDKLFLVLFLLLPPSLIIFFKLIQVSLSADTNSIKNFIAFLKELNFSNLEKNATIIVVDIFVSLILFALIYPPIMLAYITYVISFLPIKNILSKKEISIIDFLLFLIAIVFLIVILLVLALVLLAAPSYLLIVILICLMLFLIYVNFYYYRTLKILLAFIILIMEVIAVFISYPILLKLLQ